MKTILYTFITILMIMMINSPVQAASKISIPVINSKALSKADTAGLLIKSDQVLPCPEKESYVNDIPFNTREISTPYFIARYPRPEEEAFISDIPFDTYSVALRFKPLKDCGIEQESEAYINDIPFSTRRIASEILDFENARYARRGK